MTGRADPRRLVHVDADVALARQQRLAGVKPHPHAHRPGRQLLLRLSSRAQRFLRVGKGDEERVPLRVDLDAAVRRERLAQRRRCTSSDSAYAEAPSSCNSAVEPSMSVKRNVTVPAGSSRIRQ